MDYSGIIHQTDQRHIFQDLESGIFCKSDIFIFQFLIIFLLCRTILVKFHERAAPPSVMQIVPSRLSYIHLWHSRPLMREDHYQFPSQQALLQLNFLNSLRLGRREVAVFFSVFFQFFKRLLILASKKKHSTSIFHRKINGFCRMFSKSILNHNTSQKLAGILNC